MMQRLFVDTSAWFAYANSRDPDHDVVRHVFRGNHGRLTTTNFIFDETVSLCLYRLGHAAAMAVGSVMQEPGVVDLVRITSEDERDAWSLFCRRADKRYSFTDCTSFVLMQRLQMSTALALDDDFRAEGFLITP